MGEQNHYTHSSADESAIFLGRGIVKIKDFRATYVSKWYETDYKDVNLAMILEESVKKDHQVITQYSFKKYCKMRTLFCYYMKSSFVYMLWQNSVKQTNTQFFYVSDIIEASLTCHGHV